MTHLHGSIILTILSPFTWKIGYILRAMSSLYETKVWQSSFSMQTSNTNWFHGDSTEVFTGKPFKPPAIIQFEYLVVINERQTCFLFIFSWQKNLSCYEEGQKFVSFDYMDTCWNSSTRGKGEILYPICVSMVTIQQSHNTPPIYIPSNDLSQVVMEKRQLLHQNYPLCQFQVTKQVKI